MNLTGFLHSKYARIFMQELWDLLISAQENIGGIPTPFLEKKKEEIRQKKVRMRSLYCVYFLSVLLVGVLVLFLLSHSPKSVNPSPFSLAYCYIPPYHHGNQPGRL